MDKQNLYRQLFEIQTKTQRNLSEYEMKQLLREMAQVLINMLLIIGDQSNVQHQDSKNRQR